MKASELEAGFRTAQSPYGTDLLAAAPSPESNVYPYELWTLCHASQATAGTDQCATAPSAGVAGPSWDPQMVGASPGTLGAVAGSPRDGPAGPREGRGRLTALGSTRVKSYLARRRRRGIIFSEIRPTLGWSPSSTYVFLWHASFVLRPFRFRDRVYSVLTPPRGESVRV